MSKVIIGIHGLANKPEKEILSDWWTDSLVEGQKNVPGGKTDFEFRLVYWAGRLYSHPLHTEKLMDFDSHFNSEPYYKADPTAPVGEAASAIASGRPG